MKKHLELLTFILLPAALLLSCGDTGGPQKKNLLIDVDKNRITCSGDDMASFSVTYGDEDVSDRAQICVVDRVCLASPVFSSTEIGEYEFYATYTDGDKFVKSDNTVTVTVTGEFDPLRKPHKNVSFFIWTATWCAPCYILKASLNIVMDEEKYEGRIVYVNFYTSDESLGGKSDDAVACPLTEPFSQQLAANGRFFITGYPTSVIDFTKSVEGGIPVLDLRSLVDTYIDNPGLTAIRVDSSVKDGKINATVSVGAGDAGRYYLGILLTEDNVKAFQNDQGGGDYNYNHTNVARAAGTESIFGELLGEMEAGDVISKTYSFDILPGYNAENLKLLAYTLYDNEWGVRILANSVKSPADGFTDYRYAD